MVITIYITYVLLAVINTWYLVNLIKLKKKLVTSAGDSKQLKETRISIALCMFIYLADILFATVTTTVV
ncbi:hypothetical protein [Yersinia enterocolitica]|uniref:hypothetical protein n=1 Tax=Yersinia enterocolitica TaxID=630 RepID=UPI001C60D752|nr:hypothetical protein [Yersinia enterocolitica]MBW5823284.1 hypothetical protein [Yersinia enterocolitica]MBW5853107.1 hypothetical protein [Yersinia enterocolitica]MBW5870499.1 hypothetical protein [Yersinia enterocolitica]MBW5879306.1 hypothetical protein [Yersinia enterocolitica]MBX9477367.1 hypothetical protein [Yersinia enterocolitica]